MTDQLIAKKIWFVYDGECPLCKTAALALKIKQEYGQLTLLNARGQSDHWLIEKINSLNFDLDEGMVIYDGSQFYHGKTALSFMARFGENKGWFNLSNKIFFRSKYLAKVVYPWMRGVRNLLLKRREIDMLDNLNLKNQPIFKSIFAENWDELPIVMKKHYANRPYTDDVTIVEGQLEVMCAGPIKLFAPLFWLLGNIPPQNEKNVAVTVRFESRLETKEFRFNRLFYFQDREPHNFQSSMVPVEGNELIEMMKFGLGWKMAYLWQDNHVKLIHRGYVFKLFGHFIPLPITWLLGQGNATETAIDEHNFAMSVDITHPWWGKIYQYNGQFKVKEAEYKTDQLQSEGKS